LQPRKLLALPDHTMDERIAKARAKLGAHLLLGHHYQRDEVIRFADATGDSYKLCRVAAATDAKYIVSASTLHGRKRRRAGREGNRSSCPT